MHPASSATAERQRVSYTYLAHWSCTPWSEHESYWHSASVWRTNRQTDRQ